MLQWSRIAGPTRTRRRSQGGDVKAGLLLGLSVDLACAVDYGDGFQPGPVMPVVEPGHVVDNDDGACLDAAVIAINGLAGSCSPTARHLPNCRGSRTEPSHSRFPEAPAVSRSLACCDLPVGEPAGRTSPRPNEGLPSRDRSCCAQSPSPAIPQPRHVRPHAPHWLRTIAALSSRTDSKRPKRALMASMSIFRQRSAPSAEARQFHDFVRCVLIRLPIFSFRFAHPGSGPKGARSGGET